MEKEVNIGGYDDNAFFDRKAVNYFERILLESDVIMPYISANDKTPNFDGYFEICKDTTRKKIPNERFDVQVKSLNHDYSNKNKLSNTRSLYKYSCDTKVMNAVLQGITKNPVLLILVDASNRFIFWKYISVQFCIEFGIDSTEHKTIFFDECDKITDCNKWTEELRTIYHNNTQQLFDPEKNTYILPKNCRTVPIEAQKAFDFLNNLLDGELWFIKKYFFPNVWKFGIAYYDDISERVSCVGIYRIEYGENNYFIKIFDENNDYYLTKMHYGGQYKLMDIVQASIKDMITAFFKEDIYYIELLPDIVLTEIVFNSLDKYLVEKAMRQRKKEQDRIILGWPKRTIDIAELVEIIQKEHRDDLIIACNEELIRRGYKIYERPWDKLTSYHVSKEDEHCVSFEEDEDRVLNEKTNKIKFLDGIMYFYMDITKKFGDKSEKVFNKNSHYLLSVSDDLLNFQYFEMESKEFKIEWYLESENEELRNLMREPFSLINQPKNSIKRFGSSLMIDNCSWYKMWRILCRRLFMSYIGLNEDEEIV